VLPVKSALAEENFQTLLVMKALQQLGYTVKPWEELDYPLIHVAVANGDASFMANHWNPHHAEFYQQAGGDAKLSRKGVYAAGAAQGYMIDKKTADKHQITHLDQLKDPALAALFDIDGDGKANLIGPNAGWGGEAVVAPPDQGFRSGKHRQLHPGQLSGPDCRHAGALQGRQARAVLRMDALLAQQCAAPGQEVVWLQVSRSSMPGVQAGTDTKLPNGRNYGFPLNNEYIVANKLWVEQNPAAGKLFEIMQIPINDISRQNQLLREGESKPADIQRHVDAWIKAHQKTFDAWIAQAKAAALKS
jgi:glycine betaine/proline transport system substrate-binding protein